MQLKLSKKIQITYKLVFKNRPFAAAERPFFSPFFFFFPSFLLYYCRAGIGMKTTKIAYHPRLYLLPNLRGEVPIFRPIRLSPHSNFIPISFQFYSNFVSIVAPRPIRALVPIPYLGRTPLW